MAPGAPTEPGLPAAVELGSSGTGLQMDKEFVCVMLISGPCPV